MKIGDRVTAEGIGLGGKVMDVEIRRSYDGPKAGPYRVKPTIVSTYVVQHDDGAVRRYKNGAGLVLADA